MKNTNRRKFIRKAAGSAALLIAGGQTLANIPDQNPMVRVARLKIDPAQLDSYKVLLKEVGETSVKTEPGVLSLYSASEKSSPSNIIVFEIYADEASYKSHIETSHFKKYKTATKDMVQSLELLEMDPIALASKK